MKYEDYKEIDLALKKYRLFYDKFDLTQLLRDEIIYQIRNKGNAGTPKVDISKRLFERILLSIFQTFFKLFSNKKYWVFSNSDRRKILNGKYIDRVASIVSEVYPKETLFIESAVLTNHKSPTKDIILSESLFQLLGFICFKLNFNKSKISYLGNISEIEEKYKIKINTISAVKKFIGQYKAMKLILKIKKPPTIVFMVYPSGYYGYIKLFKEKEIPIIELQHGIIYKEHPSYNYSDILNANQFKPNYIFTYGKMDKECLSNIGFLPDQNILSVGSYMLAKQHEQGIIQTNYLNTVLNKVNDNKLKVLITSTINDLDEMIEWSKKVAIKYNNLFFLILPRVATKEDIIEENIIVLNPHKTNFYEVIKICDVHITQSSTCSLEALYFNKRSLIYEKERGTSMFRRNYDFINSLEFFSLIDEFYTMINTDININNNIELLFDNNTLKKFEHSMRQCKLLNE
ncbi:MAG: hypothetical protein JJE44_06085 [Flavobacteriaceae bacterium]|nr:hypothetical protein [Flavobacteriaceae bacterium]